MRTLIDKLLGRKQEETVEAVERKADVELKVARKEFLRTAHRHSRAMLGIVNELLDTVDEQKAEIERLRDEKGN